MSKEQRTRDHLTPRCIGKALGWTPDEINHPDNIQMLKWGKHREKDQTTPWELQTVLRNGGAKTLWEHHNEIIICRRGIPAIDK